MCAVTLTEGAALKAVSLKWTAESLTETMI